MKTTLEELNRMFKLTDSDSRQLKIGLTNRITVVDDNNVLVKDEELEDLISEFRTGGTYTMEEVTKLYKISPSTLLDMVKTKSLSSFRLSTNRGSRILFLKSEVEKETNVMLSHTTQINMMKFARLGSRIFRALSLDGFINERDYNMYQDYYFSNMTLEEIAEKNKLSRERIKQIMDKNNMRILMLMRRAFKNIRQMDEAVVENATLKKKCEVQEKVISAFAELKNYFDSEPKNDSPNIRYRSIKMADLNLSVRLLNTLYAAKVDTVEDLLNKEKSELVRKHSFGKKTLEELQECMKSLGIDY